jgi:hypothetical protein
MKLVRGLATEAQRKKEKEKEDKGVERGSGQ